MKRLRYFQPFFESSDPNDGEPYKYPDTETPLADADDKSIFFEYYNDSGTAYALEIYPNKRSSRLSFGRLLRNGTWYYQDGSTYIPLDINTDEKPSGKSFDPTPIKVYWLNNAALPDYEYLIKSIEDEAQEGENLWRWIRATISAVEWSFDNDIGRWKTADRKFLNAESE